MALLFTRNRGDQPGKWPQGRLGRTDNPQGKLYEYKPKNGYPADMANFVEMCFDPKSPMNAKLKQTLVQMLREVDEE